MPKDTWLPITVPRFDERHYLEASSSAQDALKSGQVETGLEHYLRYGIDENRYSLIRREPTVLAGSVERFLVSQSGFCLMLGWLGDEGCDQPRYRLIGSDFTIEFPPESTFRYARADVETSYKYGAYDYGLAAFGRCPSSTLLKQSMLLQVNATAGSLQAKVTPELVSDKRIMDTLLEVITTCQAHAGVESVLNNFLSGPGGLTLVEAFKTHVTMATTGHYVQRFGARKVTHSFVTVLFGSTEPLLIQPILFREAGIDVGEWIYVCNSPEDASAMLRCAKLISDLYDVMITIVVMNDNAGFSAANNVAIDVAASDRIFVINPDVYPLKAHAERVQQILTSEDLGSTMWGGLLFYDDNHLMHSGMYIERDAYVRRNSLNRTEGPGSVPQHCRLLRVEHFDKGVPFDEAWWQVPREVPLVSGAVMAFDRKLFQKINGFSTGYIYGHYEDADLSIRWREANGPVAIHPFLRFVHLEGQGSKVRGEFYRGAFMSNRHFFTSKYGELFDNNLATLSKAASSGQ